MNVDPREFHRCACPRIDRRQCIDFRSGWDLRSLLAAPGDPEYNEIESGEECECACHDAYDASLESED